MISFVWPSGVPMFAGTGGSETYTAGHVRELLRRGIPAQIVSVGHGTNDGRDDFPDIPFLALKDPSLICELPGKVVFVNRGYGVGTKQKAAIILHCATPSVSEKESYRAEIAGKTVLATSVFSSQQWALYLNVPYSRIKIVLPFADPIFGNVKRSKPTKRSRIIFAGRLHPDKGIYTVLEMMHQKAMQYNGYEVNLVAAGLHVETGCTIAKMLKGYPYVKLIPAAKNILSMAKLLAKSDILIMPSVYLEPFGMLSVEAQHAGCRVVASNIGGLPETNCGLLSLVEPRDPFALAKGIHEAVSLGPASKKEREIAKESFTLDASVDSLLEALSL